MTSAEVKGSRIVLRRPHFRCFDNGLFFLISNRPHALLSDEELAVWNALEDEPSIDHLRTRFPETAEQALRRFNELGVCEVVESGYAPGRRRILVIEPHGDDAVLSVGGTMWLRRHECEFIVATVGSRSNFTSYYDLERDYFNVDLISSLRSSEGALFARAIGGEHRSLGEREAALRYHDADWSLDWFRQHKFAVSAFIGHHSTASEVECWAGAIRKALRDIDCDEVWFPLGSPHTDHELTRDACLMLIRQEPALFANRRIRIYQDVPYAARFPTFTDVLVRALTQAGAKLVPEVVPITSAFSDKLRLISIYASQFKLKAIEPDVSASARAAAANDGLAERLWSLEACPDIQDPLSFRADAPIVRATAQALSRHIAPLEEADCIRLLLLVPAGRWAEDIQYLLQRFDRANLDVYVANAAETDRFVSPRVKVNPIGAGPKAWVRLALRLMLMRPAPTFFVAGDKRLREAIMMSMLWPMSKTVVVRHMDHLVSALRILQQQAQ